MSTGWWMWVPKEALKACRFIVAVLLPIPSLPKEALKACRFIVAVLLPIEIVGT